jgi:hypothetical protein
VRLELSADGTPFFCESCIHAKATRKPVTKVRGGERAKRFGDEIHSNLWGPAPVATKGGKRYYVTYTDDHTRFTDLNLLRHKSDQLASYKTFDVWCETNLEAHIKVFHSDQGSEFTGDDFVNYLKLRGTEQKLTIHDTPQHNGVAKCQNRTIVERIRALLHVSGLPRMLWGEVANHAVWLMNQTSTKAVEGMTPYEAVFGKKPDLWNVWEWGEKVWVCIEGGDKLGGRVREGHWLGSDKKSNGYHIYWPDKQTVTVERNIYFDPTCLSSHPLEGEGAGFNEKEIDNPQAPKALMQQTPSDPQQNPAPQPRVTPVIQHAPEPDEETSPLPARRIRKPSALVRSLFEGYTVTSA